MLRQKEMSATVLAKSLDKNHSGISHHLNVLLDAGLIKITNEEKIRNIVQHYYRSVSNVVIVVYSLTEALSQDPEFSAWQENLIYKLMTGLRANNIVVQEDNQDDVRNLLKTCYMREKKAYEESVTQRTYSAAKSGYAARNIAHILSHMQLLKDPEYMKAIKKLTDVFDEIKEEDPK